MTIMDKAGTSRDAPDTERTGVESAADAGDKRFGRRGRRASQRTTQRAKQRSTRRAKHGRGAAATRRRARAWYPILLAVLAVGTCAGYFVNLSANGWANSFYAAAVQAGSQSWEAFLFGSSDAANAITVDKPPAALWLMEISVRIFGLGSVQMLAPQVLLAGLVVLMLARSVRIGLDGLTGPVAARWAGLGAGLMFALTPVAALMFRFNNPDALLIALMAAAVLCTQQAVRATSRRGLTDGSTGLTRRTGFARRTLARPGFWLGLAGVALGFGFLTKQFQVMFIAPGLVAAWLLGTSFLPRVNRPTWRRRLLSLCWPMATMIVSAGWWVALIELLPASMHPYVGGSQNNSFLELTFGYNGLGRLSGDEDGSVGPGGNSGETGLTRMLSGSFALQGSWLLPTALLGAVAMTVLLVVLAVRSHRAAAAAVTAVAAPTPSAAQATARPSTWSAWTALAAWGGWLAVTWIVLSMMNGIVHEYYTVALSAAIAACIALAVPALAAHQRTWTYPVLGIGAAGTGAYAFWLSSDLDSVPTVLRWAVLVVGLLAGVVIVALGFGGLRGRIRKVVAGVSLAGVLFAGLAVPSVLTVNTVQSSATGSLVYVAGTGGMGGGQGGGPGGGQGGQGGGPGGQTGTTTGQKGTTGQSQGSSSTGTQTGGGTQGGTASAANGSTGTQGGGGMGGMGGLLSGSTPSSTVSDYLATDAAGYTWMAATIGANNASGYQLATGNPVMAIGGYNGTDPAPTLAQFQQYVAQGKIHYYIAGTNMAEDDDAATQIDEWVAKTFTSKTVDGTTIYDLTSASDGTED